MRVETSNGEVIDLGTTAAAPTIGIIDYSRRVTDDFGVTTVVERGFSRRLSARVAVPFTNVDALQRRLAELRATPALWVADDEVAGLSVEGFYKEFSVDLAVPPLSYCSLTVEGLTETVPGNAAGGDPAPAGQVSTLRLVQPIGVTDAILSTTSVAENDAPKWAAGTTYAPGDTVVSTVTHRIYENLVAGNIGHDPAGDPARWLDLGPTNRWAMFDEALGTATSAAGEIAVKLVTSGIEAVALLDVVGATVRVQAPGYNRLVNVVGGTATLLDLPAGTPQVTVTIAGAGQVSVGTLLIGKLVALGITEASPTASITDYSRKEADEFGGMTIVQRAWAKRMEAAALIRTDMVDAVFARIAAVRARPSLWIGQDGLGALTIYGFLKEFAIEVGESVSKLSLSIEGLSKAAPVAAPMPVGTSVVAQGSIDGISWHLGLATGDVFLRISNDGGATFGPAVRVAGEDGEPGEDGGYQQQIFIRAAVRPETPTGGGIPAGWSDGVPDGDELIWISVQYQRAGEPLGPWSLPAQIKGDKGDPGENAPLVLVQWSVDGLSGWHASFVEGDKFQRQSNDNGLTWGPAVRVVGEAASSGQDGVSSIVVFRRSATTPATPAEDTGNPPPGWFDGPPAGNDFLWQSVSRFRAGDQLQPWSAPVRISGESGRDGASAFRLLPATIGGPLVINGGAVSKPAGAGNLWADSQFYAAEVRGGGCDCTFAVAPGAGRILIGLHNPAVDATNTDITHIRYAWHTTNQAGANELQIIEHLGDGVQFPGAAYKGSFGPITAGIILGIRYDNRDVIYTINGAEARRVEVGAGLAWRFKGAIQSAGLEVSGISWSAAGARGADGLSAPLVRTQWSVDGVSGWHDVYAAGDLYQRQSNDNGVTWGAAARVVGEDGTIGADGTSSSIVFRRSATAPATPTINTGNPPPGWSDAPPAGTDILWQSVSRFQGTSQLQAWSTPVRISGENGKDAPLVRTEWSVNGTTGWHATFVAGDIYQRQSNDNGATWGAAVRVVGEGAPGADGTSPSVVFRRSATVPATPTINTGNPPPGWSDGPPAGTDLLWQSTSKFRGPEQLQAWSAPVRISGEDGTDGEDGVDGASTFTLLPAVLGMPIEIKPNSVKKTGVVGDWTSAQFHARELRGGGCECTFSVGAVRQYAYVGLHNPAVDASNTDLSHIRYGWLTQEVAGAGMLQIYEHAGDGVAFPALGLKGSFGPYTPTTILGIRYDNRYIIYTVDGIEKRRVEVGPDLRWRFRGAINTPQLKIENIAWSGAGSRGADAPLVLTQWSIDGAANWHDNFFGADRYYRQSNDGGITWGPAILGVGEGGNGVSTVFRRAAVVPATPATNSGNPPPGWSDGPPAGTDFLWLTKANFLGSVQQTAWSAPVRISGEDGKDGYAVRAISALYAIPVFSGGTAKPSWQGGVGTIELRKGGAIVTDGVTYALESNTGVTSLTLAGNQFSFAGLTGDKGGFTIVATHLGIQYRDKVVVQKTYDGAAAFQSGNAVTGPNGSGTTTVPGGREVRISATGVYSISAGQGTWTGYLDLYYRNVTDGGVEVYAGRSNGSQARRINTGTPSEPDFSSEVAGQADSSVTFTSPANDKQYEYRYAVGGSGSAGLSIAHGGFIKLEVIG